MIDLYTIAGAILIMLISFSFGFAIGMSFGHKQARQGN